MWTCEACESEGPGQVHLTLGGGLGGRGQVREDGEHPGQAAEGRHAPPGPLSHAHHVQPKLQKLKQNSGKIK